MTQTPYTPPPPPPGGSYTPPPPPPPPPSGGGPVMGGGTSSDRGIMIFLSYFGIFALIPLLTKKDDPELQWHSKNGLALTVAWFVCWIAITVMEVIMPGPVKLVLGGIGCILGFVFFIVDIVAMVKGFGGQRMRIPVVTDLAEKM